MKPILLDRVLPALERIGQALAVIAIIWFAVLMVVVIQTSYLTPPMAPSIFYLRSIAPPEITYSDMYRGVLPFVVCQVVTPILVFTRPQFAT